MNTSFATELAGDKTDQQIVELALRNAEYLGVVIDRYQKPLSRYIRRITNVSSEDVEDLLQVVFMKIYQNLNDYDPGLKFSSWVYRITRNEVISLARKQKHRHNIKIEDETLFAMVGEDDIQKDIERKHTAELLQKALGALDVKYKEILVLKFLEEKSYDEIADIIKKPPGTIATLIHRAKAKLKKQLQAYE